MQFNLFFAIIAATLAVATPARRNEPASDCSTGDLQCCQTVQTANSQPAASILQSIGVQVQDVNALVGLTCNPISVVGVGNSGW